MYDTVLFCVLLLKKKSAHLPSPLLCSEINSEGYKLERRRKIKNNTRKKSDTKSNMRFVFPIAHAFQEK